MIKLLSVSGENSHSKIKHLSGLQSHSRHLERYQTPYTSTNNNEKPYSSACNPAIHLQTSFPQCLQLLQNKHLAGFASIQSERPSIPPPIHPSKTSRAPQSCPMLGSHSEKVALNQMSGEKKHHISSHPAIQVIDSVIKLLDLNT